MTQTEVVIRDRQALAIYSDNLVPYMGEDVQIERASHVEPDPEHLRGGNWYVDLARVGGTLHFVDDQRKPFVTREHALAFEREWLRRHVLKIRGVERGRRRVT